MPQRPRFAARGEPVDRPENIVPGYCVPLEGLATVNQISVRRKPVAAVAAEPNEGLRWAAVCVLFLGILAPVQWATVVGGLLFNISRISIIIGLLLSIPSISRINWKLPDTLMVLGTIWSMIALYVTSKANWYSGFTNFLEILGPYFIARSSLANYREFIRFFQFCFNCLCVFVPLMVFEAVTHHQLLGAQGLFSADQLIRMGLMRSALTFPFPIQAGIFCASFFAPFLAGLNKSGRVGALLTVLGTIASVSAGAFSGLLIQVLLLGYGKVSDFFKIVERWKKFAIGFVLIWIVVDLISDRGFLKICILAISLSSSSAYYRLLIWQYAGAVSLEHPLFGIGYDLNWKRLDWMGSSIDAFWLRNAVAYGMPTSILIGISNILILFSLGKNSKDLPEKQKLFCQSIMFSMIGMLLSGFTVHFWNNMLIWFTMFMGLAMALSQANFSDPLPKQSSAPRKRVAKNPRLLPSRRPFIRHEL